MKLVSVYSPSHERLLNDWFLPSLRDDFELVLHRCEVRGEGSYLAPDWSAVVLHKSRCIIDAIRAYPGEVIVYSDVDVQFYAPARDAIREAILNRDIVCQLDAPNGQLCTGFFAVRASDSTLGLWQEIEQLIQQERRDQPAFNRILRSRQDIRYGCLPLRFFGAGTFLRKNWNIGERFYIPAEPVMFHANWAVGVENKIQLLRQARRIVVGGAAAILANNALFSARYRVRGARAAGTAMRQTVRTGSGVAARPGRVSLDASTVCQLKCPACPTANGSVAKGIGGGFLSFANFRRFVADHPWVTEIELSNWGEILLNPELPAILEHAWDRAVVVHAGNGVNMNSASDTVLEALVRYRLRRLTCSIDGASQETYSRYRRKGDYGRVIRNIEKINGYKKHYATSLPEMTWQYVLFGHNGHEVGRARRTAHRLGMKFVVKLSWDDLYTENFSPVTDRDLARRETGYADRTEFEQRHGKNYAASTCTQLWLQPRINHDGRLLGCSINHWADFGNVFTEGLEACLGSERMSYARAMLSGKVPPRSDIPCASCKIYLGMQSSGAWVNPPEEMVGGSPAK